MQPPIGYLDPEATNPSVTGPHRHLIELGLLRDGGLEECDVVFCPWPRYHHFHELRRERGLGFSLNQVPKVSQKLHDKKKMTRRLRSRDYLPRTYLGFCPRRLNGVWVEKPYNVDRAVGIEFLRDPRWWRKKGHLLQRYVDDPWLVGDRKTEIRIVAQIRDEGSVRVHREGLVRVGLLPFTLDDLDPRIHNSSPSLQMRLGVTEVEQYLLSELMPDGRSLEAIVEIVHDTVDVIRREKRFRGSGDFELLGYDFVLDRSGTPHLLEINRFPGLFFDQDVTTRFYTGMLRALYHDIGDSAVAP